MKEPATILPFLRRNLVYSVPEILPGYVPNVGAAQGLSKKFLQTALGFFVYLKIWDF
jgi:hypothetical protein